MPTVFTHAIVGATLAQAAPSGYSKWKCALAFIAVSIVPDLDVIAFSLGIPYGHTFGHRGFSHSLAFSLLLGLLTCLVLFVRRSHPPWKWGVLFLLTFIAGASHGLLDAATDAGLGVGLFIPWSYERIFYDFRPLGTSAISLTNFFRMRTLGVMESEIIWVWMPLLFMSVIWQLLRYAYLRMRRRTLPQEA
ncbi:metal-dependent hydrolase [Thermodesulfobacteriota bacterium]